MHRISRVTTVLLCGAVVACTDSPPPPALDAVVPVKRDTAIIELGSSCADCTLAITDSVRFGTISDSLIPMREPGMLRDEGGVYYLVFHGWGNQPILQYHGNGTLLRRIGKPGRGPGEYDMTNAAFTGAYDSLYVFSADRVLLVYSPKGDFVRSAVVEGLQPSAATTAHPMRFLAKRHLWPWVTDAPPLHVLRLDASGQVVDSVKIYSPSNTTMQMSVLVDGEKVFFYPRIESSVTSDVREGFWTLGLSDYRLEWHDSLGVARKLFGVRTEDDPDPVMTEAQMGKAPA